MPSLQSRMQPPNMMPPEEAAPPVEEEAAAKQPGKKATPVDQEAYDRVVVAGMTLLNDKSIHAKIFKLLATGKDSPAQTLGRAALQLMAILKEKSPRNIPESVIGSAAIEILMLLAEEADAAGLITVDERTLRGAGEVLIRGLADMYNIPREMMDEVASKARNGGAMMAEEEAMPEEQPQPPAQPGAMMGGQVNA